MKPDQTVSVIGLGYVGLPVAIAFAKNNSRVIAFDIDQTRIAELKNGYDRTNEVSAEDLTTKALNLSTNPNDLKEASFHIITVPTPIDNHNKPDLQPMYSASRTVGAILKPGDIVVYESTVYPGATEEECVPILEAESGLVFGQDFTIGYSPERINPGDKEHRFETIQKIVSGSDKLTLERVTRVYESVVTAGVYRAPSIKTAEAAKVIENTQRDLNIALMNELALICKELEIDTRDVLEAAGTKWNFMPFVPGLVGGHCIGVDPYYLTYRAEQIGYNPDVILAGRRINDGMGEYLASEALKLATSDSPLITVLGVTFKENVPDVRNSKVQDVIEHLTQKGARVQAIDPVADPALVKHEMGLTLSDPNQVEHAECVIFAVTHKQFTEDGWSFIKSLLPAGRGAVIDVKGVLDRMHVPDGVQLWRL